MPSAGTEAELYAEEGVAGVYIAVVDGEFPWLK